MNLSKIYDFVKSFFSFVYVAVVCEHGECTVRVKVTKKGNLLESETKHFKTYGGEVPIEAVKYVRKYTKAYRFCYVATPLVSINQGAIPTCRTQDFQRFDIDAASVETFCVDNNWSVYAYPDDISRIGEAFAQSGGVDFVFSPFAIIYSLAKKEPKSDKKLYVLSQKGSVTLAIMDKDRLYYGAYFILAPSESLKTDDDGEHLELPESLASEIEELTPLGEEMESIGTLESLDGDVKLDEFQDEHGEGESLDYDKANASIEEFAKGMDILNFIKESMGDFYKNSNYDATFIDEIIFLDGFGLGNDVIEYIQNTLLLSISQKKVDISDTICEMARLELEESA